MQTDPIQALAQQLARLPGIGTKSAQRLAYFVLDMPESGARELAAAIERARDQVHPCPICGGYTSQDPCAICRDPNREGDVICVVQEAKDVAAMEKMREFRGKYHVLRGAISPMDGIGPEDLRIGELLARVEQGGIREVILAKLLKGKGVRCTRIAHGVPIGGNLEYIDEMTLYKAMEGRREI